MSEFQAWLVITCLVIIAGSLIWLSFGVGELNSTMKRSTDRIEYQGTRIQEILEGQQP